MHSTVYPAGPNQLTSFRRNAEHLFAIILFFRSLKTLVRIVIRAAMKQGSEWGIKASYGVGGGPQSDSQASVPSPENRVG